MMSFELDWIRILRRLLWNTKFLVCGKDVPSIAPLPGGCELHGFCLFGGGGNLITQASIDIHSMKRSSWIYPVSVWRSFQDNMKRSFVKKPLCMKLVYKCHTRSPDQFQSNKMDISRFLKNSKISSLGQKLNLPCNTWIFDILINIITVLQTICWVSYFQKEF